MILELLVIAAPFYMQLTVDEVVARGDASLMLTLALGFGLLTAINVAHIRAALPHRPGGAERRAFPHGRAAVPPPDPAAAELFRKAAHRRRAVALSVDRADPQRAGRRPDPGRDRRDHGDRDPDDDLSLQRPARARRADGPDAVFHPADGDLPEVPDPQRRVISGRRRRRTPTSSKARARSRASSCSIAKPTGRASGSICTPTR